MQGLSCTVLPLPWKLYISIILGMGLSSLCFMEFAILRVHSARPVELLLLLDFVTYLRK